MHTPSLAKITLLLAVAAALSPALGAEATAESTFTLGRGENITQVCTRLRAAGATLSAPDCVKQILFANRQWFDDTFGYVWKDPASVNLDSAVRLWSGVAYQLPAELVKANLPAVDAQGQAAPRPPRPRRLIILDISTPRASRRQNTRSRFSTRHGNPCRSPTPVTLTRTRRT